MGLEEEEDLSLSTVSFSPAPHPRHQLGDNKREVTVSGGVLNEVASVLPSFLRNFREIHRGQVSLKRSTYRRLGGFRARQHVPVQREQHRVEQNLQRFQVYHESRRKIFPLRKVYFL